MRQFPATAKPRTHVFHSLSRDCPSNDTASKAPLRQNVGIKHDTATGSNRVLSDYPYIACSIIRSFMTSSSHVVTSQTSIHVTVQFDSPFWE